MCLCASLTDLWGLIVLNAIYLILLPLAIAVAAIVVSRSLLFDNPRRWIDRKSSKIGYGLKCTFCVCGWLSLILTMLYRSPLLICLFTSNWSMWSINFLVPLNFLIHWGIVWFIATRLELRTWPELQKTAPKMFIRIGSR